MFGIGPMEMGIIAVVALLIFGPEKLPEMMGQAGKMVRDFRNMTAEMSGEFEKTIAEAKGITKEFQGEVGSMRNQVNSVTKSVQKDLNGKKPSAAKKSATTSTKRSTSSSAGKKSGASSNRASSTSTTKSGSSTSTSSSTATKPKTAVAATASREDPTASISLFEPSAPRRERRARKATLSAFGDATPRTAPVDALLSTADEEAPEEVAERKPVDLNDPLARARQRRQSAGYTRKIS